MINSQSLVVEQPNSTKFVSIKVQPKQGNKNISHDLNENELGSIVWKPARKKTLNLVILIYEISNFSLFFISKSYIMSLQD